MPTTPTLKLCEDLAAAVRASWNPAAPSAADWDFFRRYGDGEDPGTELAGRQVCFFPLDEYEWESATRAADLYTHRVGCLVVERYADPGDPPREWTADRVDWTHDNIVKALRFTRGGPPAWNPKLVTVAGAVQACDVAKLVGAGKLFYAFVRLEFEELVTP